MAVRHHSPQHSPPRLSPRTTPHLAPNLPSNHGSAAPSQTAVVRGQAGWTRVVQEEPRHPHSPAGQRPPTGSDTTRARRETERTAKKKTQKHKNKKRKRQREENENENRNDSNSTFTVSLCVVRASSANVPSPTARSPGSTVQPASCRSPRGHPIINPINPFNPGASSRIPDPPRQGTAQSALAACLPT